MRGYSTVIGITNDLGSPLAKAASGVALISAGDESSVCARPMCAVCLYWPGSRKPYVQEMLIICSKKADP